MAKKNTVHFVTTTDFKKSVIEYCNRNDITMSQLGRRSFSLYMKQYPDFDFAKISLGEKTNGKKSAEKNKQA